MSVLNKILILVVMMLITFLSKASTYTSLSGRVIEIETEKPVLFATIKVSHQNGQISGAISDEQGRFVINGLSEGLCTIEVSALGRETYQKKIFISELNDFYDLGIIELMESATQLQDVVITGDAEELSAQLNKKSYSMSETISQSGGTVMDAMKAMPGVTFSQEGKVLLRGSDKVIVLVDGKQSSLTGFGNQKGLDNLPANNIEKIEIINNPSAKYDANGMAGVINIIYKKESEKGLHGSLGLAVGLGAISKRKEDLSTELGSFQYTPKYIPSLDLNYGQDKLSAFLQSEILFQEKLPNNEFSTRHYEDGSVISSQVPENRKQTHYILKGGVDFYLNDHNTLTFSGIYDWESHVDTAQVPYLDKDWIRERYINWNEEEVTGFMNYMADYTHSFYQPGHTVSIIAQFSKGWEDETYYINDSSAVRQGRDVTNILAEEYIYSGKIDYQKPLSSGRIELGAKIQYRDLPVDYTQWRGNESILYEGLGRYSNWSEFIQAAYANWVHDVGNYEVEAGLRTEYTSVAYDMDPANVYYNQNDAYDYFNLFPNARFTYNINESQNLSLFYSYRVDRPGEPELRMYPKSDDHELVKIGNPYLRPQYTQSTEVGYRYLWKSGSIYGAVYSKWIIDPFMRVYSQDTTNTDRDIILKSYANTGKQNLIGFEVIINQEISNWWKLTANANMYQNKISSYQGVLLFPYEHTYKLERSTLNTLNTKLTNTWSVSEDLQVQLTGIYFAPTNIPQGRQESMGSVDLGIKQKLLGGNGEISLVISDMFNTNNIRQTYKADGVRIDYQNHYETQTIRLAGKYKF
ncbi:TonB-dependent receptor domain-containing protein [Reichenbachiella versicolor]|uniref:TonB-dependent receptor domain-containing protein n=1 Tax=Reichenbachiella versicolor TaxID=1821036 RepID=UPI001C879D51|nr:TonB-dependent receptor [Reichenbachiella versicolor]